MLERDRAKKARVQAEAERDSAEREREVLQGEKRHLELQRDALRGKEETLLRKSITVSEGVGEARKR